MRYWVLFTLRMMIRVGLSLALIAWSVGHWIPQSFSWDVRDFHMETNLSRSAIEIHAYHGGPWLVQHVEFETYPPQLSSRQFLSGGTVYETVYIPTQEPLVQSVFLAVWIHKIGHFGIQVDYWLLCLTLLIATVATTVRWRKQPVETRRERLDE